MVWTRARRRWVWALALVLVAAAVPLTVARRTSFHAARHPPDVLLKDFEVRQEATVVPTGAVSFRIRNPGPDDPRAHRRTNRSLPLTSCRCRATG